MCPVISQAGAFLLHCQLKYPSVLADITRDDFKVIGILHLFIQTFAQQIFTLCGGAEKNNYYQ